MSDKVTPPANLARGIGRSQRGRVVVKPKDLRGTLRRLWRMTKGHRQGLPGVLLLSALTSVTVILAPLVIGRVVTAVDQGEAATTFLLLLLALYSCDWLVRFMQQFFMAVIAQRVIYHIRLALFDTMKALPLVFFDRRQHGELMSRLTNDADNISTTISSSLAQMLTYCFTIVGIFCTMLSLDALLAVVSLGGVALVLLLTRFIAKHTRKLFSQQQKALGKLNGQVEESISGMSVVKAFSQEERMMRDFDADNQTLCKVATKAMLWSGFLMPVTGVLSNFSYVAITLVSSLLAVQGVIAVGMISNFLLYTRQFTRPFAELANIYNSFQTAVAGAERIFEILDQTPEAADAPNALPLDAPRGDVELRNVSFGYDAERLVLKNVSLSIPAGSRVAIVGPTGAGKTTIIQLLTRFYDVNEGSILLDGHDLRCYRREALRRAFGVVLQDTALFAETVAENIHYGRADATREEVETAARLAEADSFIRRLPQGYDTLLSQGGSELSQGERQLLTIARAILSNAPILILDEATSSVDTVTEQKIRRAMLTITQGRSSFIIAHRLTTIRDSDLILFLADGQIAEQGTHRQLMAKGGQYAAMYRTQMGQTSVL